MKIIVLLLCFTILRAEPAVSQDKSCSSFKIISVRACPYIPGCRQIKAQPASGIDAFNFTISVQDLNKDAGHTNHLDIPQEAIFDFNKKSCPNPLPLSMDSIPKDCAIDFEEAPNVRCRCIFRASNFNPYNPYVCTPLPPEVELYVMPAGSDEDTLIKHSKKKYFHFDVHTPSDTQQPVEPAR